MMHVVSAVLSVLLSGGVNGLLLATDIAARGLDIPAVQHVIHYQVPRTTEVLCLLHSVIVGILILFTVRLHVMQRTVLLSQFCLSVCPSDACIVTKLNSALRTF